MSTSGCSASFSQTGVAFRFSSKAVLSEFCSPNNLLLLLPEMYLLYSTFILGKDSQGKQMLKLPQTRCDLNVALHQLQSFNIKTKCAIYTLLVSQTKHYA